MSIINSKRLVLKKISTKDVNQLIKNLNNWNIVKWLVNVPYPYTINDANFWIDKSNNEELCLNIYKNNILVGGISIDKRDRNVNELGYWIGEEYWGNGYALEACQSLISYFFLNSIEKTIYCGHMKGNEKSKKIILKLGFKKINTGKKYSVSRKEEVKDIIYELEKS
ncbi:GNAT family N-acetyltransferase [Pelagibacterales bacterium SAG-MED31]|nr:GNAT family N-acetyltransferase [Pelagibacterales bacterium SAG-MED31]